MPRSKRSIGVHPILSVLGISLGVTPALSATVAAAIRLLLLVLVPVAAAFLSPEQAGDPLHAGLTPSPASEQPVLETVGAPPALDPAVLETGGDDGWWRTVTAQLDKEQYPRHLPRDGGRKIVAE